MGAQRRYELLAELLEYPGARTLAVAREALEAVGERSPEASAEIASFARFVEGRDPREVEELYTRTFDLLAPCCMDVGYQLFGETYKRGSFLVKMREANRRYGVPEGSELPDHLPVMLRLLARLRDEDDPRGLAEEALLPALSRMTAPFAEGENAYGGLLRAAASLLRADYRIEERAANVLPFRLPVLQDAQPGGPDHA